MGPKNGETGDRIIDYRNHLAKERQAKVAAIKNGAEINPTNLQSEYAQ